MNQELAKKLADANFPYKYEHVLSLTPEPTLDELIEACGKEFISLERWGENEWSCEAYFGEINITGTNPIEAVTKLWLKLHE